MIAPRHKKVSRDIAEEGPERFYEPGDLGICYETVSPRNVRSYTYEITLT